MVVCEELLLGNGGRGEGEERVRERTAVSLNFATSQVIYNLVGLIYFTKAKHVKHTFE